MYGSWNDQQIMACLEEQNRQLRAQSRLIEQLEKRLAELRDEIVANGNEKGVHIDKVEYHFDQLKVDTLEGALHIGIAPGEQASKGTGLAPFFSSTEQQQTLRLVEQYIDKEVPEQIRQWQDVNQIVIGEQYVSEMTQDLKKQAPARIAYYYNHPNAQAGNELKKFIYDQTVNDIAQAVEQHLLNLKTDQTAGGDPL